VSLLANPVVLRMALVLVIALAAFVAGIIMLRLLRRGILEADSSSENLEKQDTVFPYTAVIQQLKQQKFTLQSEQQSQQRRAKTAEQITSAVMSNIPCGVLFVAPNGLIKQANAAARLMLGFASPLGMSVGELFRGAQVSLESGPPVEVSDVFKSSSAGQFPLAFRMAHQAPGIEERNLSFTVIRLTGASGEALGTACIIGDESAQQESRRAQQLRDEESAEMALDLRSSLLNIREWALKISGAAEQDQVARMATDISAETERLEKVVGGFLAGNRRVLAANAGA